MQATLGDVLYARGAAPVEERQWAALVEAIAQGDQQALHRLYDMAGRVVFTLALRLTARAETAEEVTLDVFHAIWRGAAGYDAEKGTVLAWIMNQARSRAIDRLRFDGRAKRGGGEAATLMAEPVADPGPDPADLAAMRQEELALRDALADLTPAEREAIEATFLGGLTHAEAAERLGLPLGTLKTRIRAALHKLRRALIAEGGEP